MITIHQIDKKQIILKSAEFLINNLRLYHNITQKTLLLLSGGSVVELYKPLGDFIRKSNLDWKFLTTAQVDERFQPDNFNVIASPQAWRSCYDSEQRRGLLRPRQMAGSRNDTRSNFNINAELIRKTGLWKECEKKKIPYYLISQEGTLSESADEYNNALEKLFKENIYKIAVLGIGEDGHTAGLLPGYKQVWNTANLVAGYENSGQFPCRITITPKAIKMLNQVIVVASGEKKREAIKQLTLNNKQKTNIKEQDVKKKELDEFPATILREVSQVDLFTDLIS